MASACACRTSAIRGAYASRDATIFMRVTAHVRKDTKERKTHVRQLQISMCFSGALKPRDSALVRQCGLQQDKGCPYDHTQVSRTAARAKTPDTHLVVILRLATLMRRAKGAGDAQDRGLGAVAALTMGWFMYLFNKPHHSRSAQRALVCAPF